MNSNDLDKVEYIKDNKPNIKIIIMRLNEDVMLVTMKSLSIFDCLFYLQNLSFALTFPLLSFLLFLFVYPKISQ
jgi:hypothetical protein